MATITARKRKNGMRYTAQIRIKRTNGEVYNESKTFTKRAHAKEWSVRREAALSEPGALDSQGYKGVTVGQVIQWYIDDFNANNEFGRTKLDHLRFMQRLPIADENALQLTSSQVIQHVKKRRGGGTGPATVKNDIILLRTVFKRVRPSRDIPLPLQAIEDAAELLYAEKLIGSAQARTRRPTLPELDRILTYFSERDGRASLPMVDLTLFAIFSSRRQAEICRIRWDDLVESTRSVLVRDMKSPRGSKGNHVSVNMPDEAWAIIQRQPKVDDRIFPFNSKSISCAFTRSCKVAGVKNLRFHDLRHEGASRLL